MTQPPNQTCPECGTPLPPHTPEGLCRACLLKRGLESNTLPTAQAEPSARWIPPTPAELAPRFPDLEILTLLGRGGMGAVYQARQKSLDRLVALKILPPEISRDPARAFADRFAREAQAMAKLNHPHIVTIHEFGQRDGLFFFLMEFVDGLNLRQLLDTGPVAPKEALAIVPQICDALQYAHDQGIVHRDIKPENILLNKSGQVKIADFGLAKLMGRSATEPAARTEGQASGGGGAAEQVMGTPQYMAPEQLERPDQVDHRADIYSLGVVFYQLLTGQLPPNPLTPPSQKIQIDVRLDEIVLRALEHQPEKRYQQASEVKTQVETIAQTPPPKPTAGTHIEMELEWNRGPNRLPFSWHIHKHVPIVGVRHGQRVLHWPGILLSTLIIAAFALIGSLLPSGIFYLIIGDTMPGREIVYPYIFTLVIPAVVLAIELAVIRYYFRKPLDQLPSLDTPTVPPPPPTAVNPAPHFSHAAILGAIWAALALTTFLLWFA